MMGAVFLCRVAGKGTELNGAKINVVIGVFREKKTLPSQLFVV